MKCITRVLHTGITVSATTPGVPDPPNSGILLKQNHGVTCFNRITGRNDAGRTRADDCNIHTCFFLRLISVITSTGAARNSVTILAISTAKSDRIMPYAIHEITPVRNMIYITTEIPSVLRVLIVFMLWGANANVVKNAANSPVKRMVSISECLNYFLYMKAG
ncbi:hypothetical protein (plasmid) [Escherichia coli]|uniref:Orf12 n=4 Tax=Enterobacteriaceae TaxID=543 RepID=A0A1S5QSB4_ECOLX|nr:putative acetyltransferase protein [Salmonella enterica subsp. enterica serovar Kentucky]AMQ95439.1 orf12 [Escherichia coli]QNI18102.1 hypothetical protein [Escherichia coli O1:H7]ADK62351.1 putative acetyltransferase protein [Salmonella enterica subsp. enterica serovar Kentucky]AMQ95567.1 hypothetical protein [Escherichia coli]